MVLARVQWEIVTGRGHVFIAIRPSSGTSNLAILLLVSI